MGWEFGFATSTYLRLMLLRENTWEPLEKYIISNHTVSFHFLRVKLVYSQIENPKLSFLITITPCTTTGRTRSTKQDLEARVKLQISMADHKMQGSMKDLCKTASWSKMHYFSDDNTISNKSKCLHLIQVLQISTSAYWQRPVKKSVKKRWK